MLQKELSMMSEQIQSRLDEQQKTFKCVEDQLTSNLKKKEDECREVIYPMYYSCTKFTYFNSFKKSLVIVKRNWSPLRPKCNWPLLSMKNGLVKQMCPVWK